RDSSVTGVQTCALPIYAGNIPNLVKQGFQGEIVCTSATRDLSEIMLEDSANIQEKDAEYLNKKHDRRGARDLIEPLYTVDDARRSEERRVGQECRSRRG